MAHNEMKKSQYKYSLVIPCFNEYQSLLLLIPEIVKLAENNDFEFILVDNGSTDKTNKLFSEIYRQNIKVVTLKNNDGYGGGIKAGLQHASAEFIGWVHADLQYSLTKIVQNLNLQNNDIIYLKGFRRKRTVFQYFVSFCMSIFESLLFRHYLYDINAQPTVFHRTLYNQMIEMPDDFSIDLYSFVIAKQQKVKISRFKIDFEKRSYGKSSWNSGLDSVVRMSVKTVKYSIALRKKIENY